MKLFLLIFLFGFHGSPLFAGKVISFYPRMKSENYGDMIERTYSPYEFERFLANSKRILANPSSDNLFEVLQRADFLFNNNSYFLSEQNSFGPDEYSQLRHIQAAGTSLIFEVTSRIKNPSNELVLKIFSTLNLGYIYSPQSDQMAIDYDMMTNALLRIVESNLVLSLRKNSSYTPTEILNLLLSQEESFTLEDVFASKSYKSRLAINDQAAAYLATWALEVGEIHDYESLKDFQTLLSQTMDIGRGGAETRALSTALQSDSQATSKILSRIETMEEFSDFFYILTSEVHMNENLRSFQIRLNTLREGVRRGFIANASYLANSISRIAWAERPRYPFPVEIVEISFNQVSGKYEPVEPLTEIEIEKIYSRNRTLAIAVRTEFFAKFQSFPNWQRFLKSYTEGSGLSFLGLLKLKATPAWIRPSIQAPDWSQNTGSNATKTLNEALTNLKELGAYHTKPYLYESLNNISKIMCEALFR